MIEATINMPPVDWQALAPFLCLAIGGLVTLMMAVGPKPVRNASGLAALAAVVIGIISVTDLWKEPRIAMGGMVAADHFASAFNLLFLATAFLAVLLSMADLKRRGVAFGEFYSLLLFATAGMVMMAGTTNLLVMFLGLEILSLPLYIMSGFSRTQERSLEASMKYFLMGAFSTGFTLYGMALLFGATRTLDLRLMPEAIASAAGTDHKLMLIGFAMTLIGFLFKIAAFPFHFWLPDVYQGAPSNVTAYMIAGTKAAAFAAILRVLTTAFWDDASGVEWTGLLSVIAVLTMTAGNVVALAQNNIKRMLAYSSIAHAGYILLAIVCHSEEGVASIGFYLAAYLFMNLGAFAVIQLVEYTREGDDVGEMLQAYAGLGRREPMYAAGMAVFMFALMGMPLTAGFVGKFFIFKAVLDAKLYTLAILGMINAVIGATYYLRVILYMYFREPATEPAPIQASIPAIVVFGSSLAGVFFLGLNPAPIAALFAHLL